MLSRCCPRLTKTPDLQVASSPTRGARWYRLWYLTNSTSTRMRVLRYADLTLCLRALVRPATPHEVPDAVGGNEQDRAVEQEPGPPAVGSEQHNRPPQLNEAGKRAARPASLYLRPPEWKPGAESFALGPEERARRAAPSPGRKEAARFRHRLAALTTSQPTAQHVIQSG